MKKIVAIAGIFALAACGGEETETADLETEEEVATMTASDPSGTYSMTSEEGEEVTWVLNEDGTYEQMAGGEVIQSGTWEETIRGTCLTAEGGEGEQCYNFGQPGPDGTVEVTGPDGETVMMTKEA